jgi:hypothetical protein
MRERRNVQRVEVEVPRSWEAIALAWALEIVVALVFAGIFWFAVLNGGRG